MKHFQALKQQNVPRCLMFWTIIIIIFNTFAFCISLSSFTCNIYCNVYVCTYIYTFFFLFTTSLFMQPFVVSVSRVKNLSQNPRANAFLEFAGCHVSRLMWRHARYAVWPQAMLTTMSICSYDRCRKTSAGTWLHF